MNTDTELLRKLVELSEKATPGPWQTEFNEKHGLSEYDVFSKTPHYQFVACHPSRVSNSIAHNMEFIAAARNAMPALSRLLAGVPEGWIPVGERLPEPLTPVLVNCTFFLDGEDNIHLLYMKPNEMKWRFDDTQDDLLGDGWKPTHWRYLPDGPKGASHE